MESTEPGSLKSTQNILQEATQQKSCQGLPHAI
jgi:hypothetical protein